MKITTEVHRSHTDNPINNQQERQSFKDYSQEKIASPTQNKPVSESSRFENKIRNLDKELHNLQTQYTFHLMKEVDTLPKNQVHDLAKFKKNELFTKINQVKNEMENLIASLSLQDNRPKTTEFYLQKMIQTVDASQVKKLIRN